MAKRPDGLTPRQARFVDEYLIDLNATRAAIRAGYSEHTADSQGSRLLKNAKVCTAIAAKQAERAGKSELTTEWIIERLIENANRAMEAEPARDAAGKPIGIYTYQGNVANKALELLGKHRGIFLDKVQMTGQDGGPLQVAVCRTFVHVTEPAKPPTNRIKATSPNGHGNGRPRH